MKIHSIYEILIRLIIVFPGLFLQGTVFSQGTWESISIPTEYNINHLHFTDSLTGWIVGDSGLIMHTIDGGTSWNTQESNTTNNIISVFFTNNEIGWAASHNFQVQPYGSEILKTIDGGNIWTVSDYFEENKFISSIFFHDSLNGWMGGVPHALVKSTDGGNSWTQATIDTSTLAFFPVLNITFYDSNYGYASGGIFDIAGVIWITEDGGNLWNAISTDYAPADEVHGLHIFNPTKIYGSGGDPDFGFGVGFMKTENAGANWIYDEIGVQGIAYDIDFVSENEGWAPLGPEQNLLYSLDTGQTWQVVPTPGEEEIFDIVFPDSNHGYGSGRNGAFIRFTPEPVSVGEAYQEPDMKIYPNPAKSTTTIEVKSDVSISPNSSIIIYNNLGKLVMEIPLGSNNKINLDCGEIDTGIYHITVVSNRMVIKKDILVIVDY